MLQNSMFVTTVDKETADKLLKFGMRMISDINGVYTFENKMSNMHFNEIDAKKVVYTNMISL